MKKVAIYVVLAMLFITTAAVPAQNTDAVKWAWRCSSMAFYKMEVLPNGKYRPVVDSDYGGPLTIKLRSAPSGAYVFCSGSSYYVEVSQSSYGLFTTHEDVENPCAQVTTLDFGKFENNKPRELERLRASIDSRNPMSLELMRDDVEWRFILSGTDLTTEREARELRVLPRSPLLPPASASAEVYFATGECILDQKP